MGKLIVTEANQDFDRVEDEIPDEVLRIFLSLGMFVYVLKCLQDLCSITVCSLLYRNSLCCTIVVSPNKLFVKLC